MQKMMIYPVILVLASLSFFNSHGQNSFTYMVSTPADERIFDGAENEYGEYFLVGRKLSNELHKESAYLLVLSSAGQMIYEKDFYNEDSSSYFSHVYCRSDSIIIFGGKGSESDNLLNELWVIILDGNYNVIRDNTYNLGAYDIIDLESIIKRNGNYLICGDVDQQGDADIFFYEISQLGDSINHSIVPLESLQFEFDLIEKDSGGYKVFAFGSFPGAPHTNGTIVEFDSLFNYISADSVPSYIMDNIASRWLTDTTYLLTGKNFVSNPSKYDMGIIKLDYNDQLLHANHYGKSGDTSHHVGACSNLEIISKESIYFGGTSNIIESHLIYQPEDSWILLNNIDSNLNLNWQKFYGGDAFYYLWGLKGTLDGGCLLLCTRYDADIQDEEMDIFIIKVDSNGLLTSTGNEPKIPVQQLSVNPNPSGSVITLRYPDIFGCDEKEIIIINFLGNQVKQIPASQNPTEIRCDISDLASGLYFVILQVKGKIAATGKILVVR
jgi:hypothetical protein